MSVALKKPAQKAQKPQPTKPEKAPKAEKPEKAPKAEPAQADAGATIHGVSLTFGDVVKGGTAKSSVTTILPISAIVVEKGFNPRHRMEGIDTLAASIKSAGLLCALTVRPTAKDGVFSIVSGERRFHALQKLGREDVPVLIRSDLKDDDDAARAAAIAENSEDGRSNLNAIELGRVFKGFATKGWDVATIAKQTGVSGMTVRRALTLMEAPEDIRKKVESGEMSVAPALELTKLGADVREAIKGSLSAGSSVNDIKRLAKDAGKALGGTDTSDGKSAKKKKGPDRAASIVAWRSSKDKQAKIIELSALLHSAGAEDQDTQDYFEVRGAVAALFWARGDLDKPTLPAMGTTNADEKKLLKVFDGLVAAAAAKQPVAPVEPTDEE